MADSDLHELDAEHVDAAFRGLRDAPEPLGLTGSRELRRRGDRRRVASRAGAVAVVGLLTVGTVAAVDAARRGDPAGRQLPATSPEAPTATIAAEPMLRPRDVDAVGGYAGFTVAGPVPAPQPFLLDCLPTPDGWGATDVQRRSYSSDTDATFTETVLAFEDQDAALRAMGKLARTCATPGPAQRWQQATVPGDAASRRVGRLTTPPGGGDFGYQEVAITHRGPVVVVLDWSSMGLPRGEDSATATIWDWAWSDQQVAAAVDRAVEP